MNCSLKLNYIVKLNFVLENVLFKQKDIAKLVPAGKVILEIRNQIINTEEYYSDTQFMNCKFIKQVSCINCEFHDCNMQSIRFSFLINCKLFSCILSNSDFTNADIRFSEAKNCEAFNCRWESVITCLDCRWWSGLKVGREDLEYFKMLAAIPQSALKSEIIKSMTPQALNKFKRLINREFRKI